MQKIYLWIIFYACHGIIETLGSSSVDCDFNSRLSFWVVGTKYRCEVSNNLNISSPESAIIDAVNGTHMSGKSNNDEIYFYAWDEHIEYFPRGLEKIFTNLTGIVIGESQLKEIHQEDLKPYTKLKYLNLYSNNIEVIEDGLFDFQPDIEVIGFGHSKIFHISSTVFDNLSKLTTLSLSGKNCINKYTTNNRTDVLEIIKSVKSNCTRSDYIKLDEKLKNLEQRSKNLHDGRMTSFLFDFKKLVDEFKKSKFSNFQMMKNRIVKLSEVKRSIMVHALDEVIEWYSLSESKNQSSIRNQWMIIAAGVIAFTQTILLVIIYIQFIQ